MMFPMTRQDYLTLILCTLTVSCGTHASRSAPGLEPYIPTKLEWLQVEAQTELSENAPCYAVNITRRAPDTIVVVVIYKKCTGEESARIIGAQDVDAVRLLAQSHGWKSWVKVEKDVHLLNGDGRE
jgi:hypothetical protein